MLVLVGHISLSLPQSHHKKKDRGVNLLYRTHTHTDQSAYSHVLSSSQLSCRLACLVGRLCSALQRSPSLVRSERFSFCSDLTVFLVNTRQDGRDHVTEFSATLRTTPKPRPQPDSSTISTVTCSSAIVDGYKSQTSHHHVFSSIRSPSTHNRKIARC